MHYGLLVTDVLSLPIYQQGYQYHFGAELNHLMVELMYCAVDGVVMMIGSLWWSIVVFWPVVLMGWWNAF